MPSTTCGWSGRLISCLSPGQTLHILPPALYKWDTAERSNKYIYTNCPKLSLPNGHSVTRRRKYPLRWMSGVKGFEEKRVMAMEI